MPAALRLAVYEQRGRKCFCCGMQLTLTKRRALDENGMGDNFTYVTVMEAGHAFARSKGGPDIFANLFPLCALCNGLMGPAENLFSWISEEVGRVDRQRLDYRTF